jgi:hypothetical protein
MELLFVTLGGLILGLAARYALPHRAEVGVAITWAGLAWDGGWIWVISLVLAGLASAGTEFVLGRRRTRADEQLFTRLIRG